MTHKARATRAVLIAGPTASGKSALAMAVAARFGGTVVNVDSMQVYRDLRVITARPNPADEARVPHRLYGHVDAAVNYSAGRYLADCAAALDEIHAAGRLPVLVGGTGLYFKALVAGLSAIPPVAADIRAAVRERLVAEGSVALHAALAARDPEAAAGIRPGDPVRVARALEVLEATGRSILHWRDQKGTPLLAPDSTLRVFLDVDRAELARRIESRFAAMLRTGALEEVAALAARGLDPLLPAMKAHGVPWLMAHRRGEMALEEAAALGVRDTRRYAKRQQTWFRHQLADWSVVVPDAAEEFLARGLGAGGG